MGLNLTLSILFCWSAYVSLEPSLKHIDSRTLTTSITLDEDDYGNIIIPTNLAKIASKINPYPIICGTTKQHPSCCIIRFIDSKHNKEQGLPSLTKSYIVIDIASIPYVGIEPTADVYRLVKIPSGYTLKIESKFGFDGGLHSAKFVSDLIGGHINGMQIK